MSRRIRWGADVAVPLLLVALYLFSPVAAVRYLALVPLVLRGIALLYAWLASRAIEVSRTESVLYTNRFAAFEVTLTVRNRLPLPVHYLRVGDRAGAFVARSSPSFVLGLGPFEQRELRYTLEGHQRGEFQLGPVDISGSDGLGLFPFGRQIEDRAAVMVYPSVFRLDLDRKSGLPSGNLTVSNRLFEDITRFRSIREYLPGDELKRVNWKASARLNKLFTMEYEPSIYFPVLVLLNLTAEDYPLAQRAHQLERAIEMAASLVFYCVELQQKVGLMTSGHISGIDGFASSPVRPGYAHANAALELLARVSTSQAAAGGEPPNFADLVLTGEVEVASGSRILVVSPPLREQHSAALLALRRRGFKVEAFVVSSQSTTTAELQVPGLTTHRVSGYGKALIGG